MRRKTDSRPLWLAAGLLLGFILLSGALARFSLAPGLRIRVDVHSAVEEAFVAQERRANPLGGELLGWIVSVTTGVAIILFFVALFRKENRLSTLFALVLAIALAFLLANLVQHPDRLLPDEDDVRLDAGDGGALGMIDPLDPEDAVDEHPERQTPPWVWTLAVMAPAAVGLYFVLRPYMRRRAVTPAAELGRVASDAADSIEAGEALGDVILRCYRDMVATLEAAGPVHRRESMTPREFEAALGAEGLGLDDIRSLTSLFEMARYSPLTPSGEDEQAAVEHLRRIASRFGAAP